MRSEFLPRAHSRRLGELDESNWKSLDLEHNVRRVDPAIREIVLLLNEKGYRTFSSCSGGHPASPRKKIDRHERGYVSFSPPSMVAFDLYMALRKKNTDFGLEADVVVEDWNGDGRESIYTQLNWRLNDDRSPRRKYYDRLFSQMTRIIALLPEAPSDHKTLLSGLLGRKAFKTGSWILARQMARFQQKE